ncbi:MAG TPA: hypothetical protein VJB98_03535 [Candidatus Paceibacterota bacterium]
MEKIRSPLAALTALLIVGTLTTNLMADSSVVTVTVITPECNDTLDNDSDTFVDYPADPGCVDSLDNNETDPSVAVACNDGTDNDSDGKTDYPADLGCDSASDTEESGEITAGGGGPISGGAPPVMVGGARVTFQGVAFPGATVTLLADGKFLGSALVGGALRFTIESEEITPGVYTFSLYGKDGKGNATRTLTYTLRVMRGSITQISGIDLSLFYSGVTAKVCPVMADMNDDCKVNLFDFSIAAFWWERSLSIEFTEVESNKLSGDGQITLEDFSIMAFYWTG